MKHLFLLITLSILGKGIAFAQHPGSITGQLTNEEGEPLNEVVLTLQETNMTLLSDAKGNFAFTNLPLGTYRLLAKDLSYKEQVREIVLSRENAHAVLQITLQAASSYLQDVEVLGRKETSYKSDYSFIGTKTASRLIDVPQTISSITKELMDDQQAYRLNDVVKNISGVNQYSQWDDLTVRGFRNGFESGFRLVNGMRSGFSYGNGFFRVPLTANLERVEVLKGPGAALFGDINPGGTVNLVTKKPLAENRKAVSFSVGSFNTTRAALDFTGPLNENKTLLYRLNLGYEDSETFRDIIENKSLIVAPSITFLPTDKTTINAELVYSNFNGYLDRGLPIQGNDLYALPLSFALNQPSDYFIVRDFYLNTSLNHRFTSWLSFNASYMKFSYSENLSEHRTLNTFADAPQNTVMNMRYYERQVEEYTDNFSAYFVINGQTGSFKHKVLVGTDYVKFTPDKSSVMWEGRQKVAGKDTVGLTFDLKNPLYEIQDPTKYLRRPLPQWFIDYVNASYSTTGIYLQNQVDLTGRLQILAGFRYEFYRDQRNYGDGEEPIKQGIFLPRLGITYKITNRLNYFASYSSGFLPIKPEYIKYPERYGHSTPFENESSYQVETGLKGEFFNQALFASISLYHIEKQNMLVNTGQLSDQGNPIYRQNGKVRSRGAELELTGNLHPNLNLHANYAFNRSEVMKTSDPGEEGQMNANAPEHVAGFWAKYTFSAPGLNGLGLALGGTYVGKRRMQNQVQNDRGENVWDFWPAYALADAAVFYNVNKFKLTVNFNNLFDKAYFVGGYDYYRASPGAPRNFMATIGYTF
ncbi:TonB-dependent receptor [Rapidithrix thailandica]|uniref:TonB-dependent receptor n=1 Tax=Rapidithrix thailandica TaxID=413964 RepID=A0AAW9SIG4_9BACT